jgi:pyruvate carboxylase
MALAMVSAGLTPEDIEDPDKPFSFPDSVVSFFHGDLGQPPNGFPEALQKKVLGETKPLTDRPGASLPAADLEEKRKEAEEDAGRAITDEEFQSWLMYPKVFKDFAAFQAEFGPVDRLPTMNFFYGMSAGDEISVEIERGKALVIRCLTVAEPDEEGIVRIFFELNGQPRRVKIQDRKMDVSGDRHPKAEPGNPKHVAAPMPGLVATVAVEAGKKVAAGDLLLTIEAMKMETAIRADADGEVARVVAGAGTQVDAKDLLVEMA